MICASTGNTSASAAAYAARAGLLCAVLVPRGKIALGKLAQALVHGAKLLQIDGNFDDCLALASKLAQDYPVTLVNSVNPDRIEGQKTASFEIIDALGDAPDVHCLPVGNAGNITAYWKGYVEYAAAGRSTKRPMMRGFQAAGCRADRARPRRRPAVDDRDRDSHRQSGQLDQGARCPRRVGRRDRVGDRPADPVGLPAAGGQRGGVRRAGVGGQRRRVCSRPMQPALCRPALRVVCTVTGNGLKDPEWAIAGAPAPVTIAADVVLAAKALGLDG